MDNVTVACSCGRTMTTVGNAPKGTFRCGCGNKVIVTIAESTRCAGMDGGSQCRNGPNANTAARYGFSLCNDHEVTFDELLAQATAPRLERLAVEAEEGERRLREFNERMAELRNSLEKSPPKPPPSVVYYARFGDYIKIGFTTGLRGRMLALGPDEVLAAEPGGRTTENARHKQFADLRLTGIGYRGERFRSGDSLMAHIAAVRAEHGDPYEVS